MNLRQLEAFRATVACGSATGAAKILNISQPSVSRLLSDLEASVGFPLFVRAGRGIVATVEARRFFHAVDSMFVGVDHLRDLAETIRTTAGGVVCLGAIPAFSHIVMPQAVRDLYAARPDVRVMIHIRNTPGIVDAVRTQQFDLGIVGRSPPYEGVETLYSTSVPYVCLLPEAHPLARKTGRLDLEKIADSEDFVTFGGAYPDEMLEIDSGLSARLRQSSRLYAANVPVAASLVRETGALAIVDPYTAEVAGKLGGVIGRPIKQNLKYNIALITRGEDTFSLEAREMAEVLIGKFKEPIAFH